MRELPILFSTPMVKAILENRKTMTRRTQGLEVINKNPEECELLKFTEYGGPRIFQFKIPESPFWGCMPHYQIGDKIWIRETFYAYGYWFKTGNLTKTGKDEYEFIDLTHERGFRYLFETNSEKPNKTLRFNAIKDGVTGWFKRPSLFLPKQAARIWIEITNIQSERLQSITTEDCISEGIHVSDIKGEEYRQFVNLWESINGKDSWLNNPYVFVYEFKRIEHA